MHIQKRQIRQLFNDSKSSHRQECREVYFDWSTKMKHYSSDHEGVKNPWLQCGYQAIRECSLKKHKFSEKVLKCLNKYFFEYHLLCYYVAMMSLCYHVTMFSWYYVILLLFYHITKLLCYMLLYYCVITLLCHILAQFSSYRWTSASSGSGPHPGLRPCSLRCRDNLQPRTPHLKESLIILPVTSPWSIWSN